MKEECCKHMNNDVTIEKVLVREEFNDHVCYNLEVLWKVQDDRDTMMDGSD